MCEHQIFGFKYHYSADQQCLSICFRCNFYIPFEEYEDEPEIEGSEGALLPLCFEVAAMYRIPRPEAYEYRFFLTEVAGDLAQAAQEYGDEVERYRPIWGPLLEEEPSEVWVFQ